MCPMPMQDEDRQRFTQKCVVVSISGRLKRRIYMETHKNLLRRDYFGHVPLPCCSARFSISAARALALNYDVRPDSGNPSFANIIMIAALFVWWKWF